MSEKKPIDEKNAAEGPTAAETTETQESVESKLANVWDSANWGNPLDFLGVTNDATDENVKKVYKTLVLKYHPGSCL